jgi:hypothetical protein
MRSALVLTLLLVAGCGDQRSFDERYADTQQNIENRARQLDAELNKAEADNAVKPAPSRPAE